MTVRAVCVDVLLGLAAVIVLTSSVGLLVMRDVYQKIHYLTPAGLVAPVVVGLAVLVQSGWTLDTAETGLALLFVAIASPVLTHATIRAARIRETGDWRPRAGRGARAAADPGAAGSTRAGPASGAAEEGS